MPKTIVNPFTGNKRRQEPKYTDRGRRDPSLYADKKMDRSFFQEIMLSLEKKQSAALNTTLDFLSCSLILNQLQPVGSEGLTLYLAVCTGIFCQEINDTNTAFNNLVEMEASLCDIPPGESEAETYSKPPKWTRIDDFVSNSEAKNFTNYNIDQLRELVDLFGLPEWITVPTASRTRYRFHREELLIYMFSKAKGGHTHAEMADKITFGYRQRWSYGYKWIVTYLDFRYYHLIGPEGLGKWAPHFPAFTEAIRAHLAEPSPKWNADIGQTEIIPGIYFPPGIFKIFCFGDCSDWPISTPLSGPEFDICGSKRKPWWYIHQKAFFGGHHNRHALKTLSYTGPNGLTLAVFGPYSCRRNDRKIFEWTNVDNTLANLNQHQFGIQTDHECFMAYYDNGIFGRQWRCHRSPHRSAPGAPLTDDQKHENNRMSAERITVEWSYGDIDKLWALCGHKKSRLMLEKDANLVYAQIRVLHLLTNIYTCFRGNTCSSYYQLRRPTAQEYLEGNF